MVNCQTRLCEILPGICRVYAPLNRRRCDPSLVSAAHAAVRTGITGWLAQVIHTQELMVNCHDGHLQALSGVRNRTGLSLPSGGDQVKSPLSKEIVAK